MKKRCVRICVSLLLLLILLVTTSCISTEPNIEPWYQQGPLYVWNGVAWVQIDTNGGGGGGSAWFAGAGAPAAGLGDDGDFYLNGTNGDVYEKAAGAWGIVANIKGPQGAQGIQGIQGIPGPNNITAGTSTDLNGFLKGDGANVSAQYPLTGTDTQLAVVGSPTYKSLQDFVDSFGSTGRKTGGTITDAGGSNVNVSAGTGFIKATDDDNAQLLFFNFPAPAAIAIPASSTRYIGVEYNAGTPRVVARTTFNWNLDSEFSLGTVINEPLNGAATLHIINNPWWVTDGMTNIVERFRSFGLVLRDEAIGGLMLSVTGTRSIAVTAGVLWSNLNEFPVAALDTNVGGTVEYYWYSAGNGWQYSDVTQYSVLQWNDTTQAALQNIGVNKYCNIWVYAEADDEEISLIYPQAEYNTAAQAADVPAPSLLPTHIVNHGILIGKIVIRQGVDAPVSVLSAFTHSFAASVVTDHGNLAGLSDDDHVQYFRTDGSRNMSGNIIFNSGYQINWGNALTSDDTCTGLATTFTASVATSQWDLTYLVAATSRMGLADGDAVTTMPCIAIATAGIGPGDVGTYLTYGYVRNDAWNWTPNTMLYVDDTTSGGITATAPNDSGDQVQVIGIAVTADVILFNPQLMILELS